MEKDPNQNVIMESQTKLLMDPSCLKYLLELDDEGRPRMTDEEIFIIPKYSSLTLKLLNGADISRRIKLLTNAYEEFPKPWFLEDLREKELDSQILGTLDRFLLAPERVDTSIYFSIMMPRPGPVIVAFLYQARSGVFQITKEFYILVEPKIVLAEAELKPSSIQIQSILSKSLGKISTWNNYFEEVSKLNYNFVHFTPIQQLGSSDSLFCLFNNNEINDFFFEEPLSREEKYEAVKSKLQELRERYGVASLVDIVLNHCANNSDWLKEHPECGFNLENCPWLNVSYEYDRILVDYSKRFAKKKVACKCAPYVNNEKELNDVMEEIGKEVAKANLEEFFLLPFEENMEEYYQIFMTYKANVRDAQQARKVLKEKLKLSYGIDANFPISNENDLVNVILQMCTNNGESRFGVKINGEDLCSVVFESYSNRSTITEINFLKDMTKCLTKVNDIWKVKATGMIKTGLEEERGRINWYFIQQKERRPLIETYFVVFDPKDKKSICVCNGWIMRSDDPKDPSPNFCKYGAWYYFSRKVVIWSDCPKLNYGNSPEHCPYLWSHMTKYVQDMALIFDGFRLDNAHSTPPRVAQYLVQKAREVKPDLLVIGELFAGTVANEAIFAKKIGINHLIRETIWEGCAERLSERLHRFGGAKEYTLGKLEESTFHFHKGDDNVTRVEKYFNLIPKLPSCIVYDQTHDNEPYNVQCKNFGLNLTVMSCLGLIEAPFGSTRGYDQLFPFKISIVGENRQYAYDNETLDEEIHRAQGEEKLTEVTFRFNPKKAFNSNTSTARLSLSSKNWTPDINMIKGADNEFSVKVFLDKGTHYYKYVLDNNYWIHDESKPTVKDQWGNTNNIIDIQGDPYTDLKILRRTINHIRKELNSYHTEFFLHRDRDLVCTFRMLGIYENYLNSQLDYDGYAIICRTGYDMSKTPLVSRVELPGEIAELVCVATISIPQFDPKIIFKNSKLIGVKSNMFYHRDISFLKSIAKISIVNNKTIIDFTSILPNTVIVLKLKIPDVVKNAMVKLQIGIDKLNKNGVDMISTFDICDFNLALYKCEQEERENNKSRGNYVVNGMGSFVYAGIAHLHSEIQKIKKSHDLSHSILQNIREGDWLLGYHISRLKEASSLLQVYSYLNDNILNEYSLLYSHHKCHFFSKIIDAIFNVFTCRFFNEIKKNSIVNFSTFCQDLALAVPQFTGYVENAKFISPTNSRNPFKLTIAAGLPYFAVDFFRFWGRDTFISLKGLLLIPGFFYEAKQIINIFASTLRHGLIPNLLARGVSPRYNSRDATWFFMQSVKDYVTFTKDYSLLSEEIEMVFVHDEMITNNSNKSKGMKKVIPFYDVIQSIFQNHAHGINYREWKAGKDIDEHMKDEGFNITVLLEPTTGFIYGGNTSNCGTWMDKMGSSEKAKNKGIPATPRNGADVEIIGLLYSSLQFILNMIDIGHYPYTGVTLSDNSTYEFSQWAESIKENFEKFFFISHKDSNDKCKVNIYKDYFNHGKAKDLECQLRPNFLIAMAVAPELFTTENAILALENAERYLLVPNGIGIRTLDSEDKNYNGNYIVADDGIKMSTAHGFNYHNGPEWVWPLGYYIISKVHFNNYEDKESLFNSLCTILRPLAKFIMEDNWRGLPELTNTNGVFCPGSCNTQAWSVATILEALSKMIDNLS